jgi:hypothetical protein
MPEKSIAVFYEHPEWFEPLFAELDRRRVAYDKLDAGEHVFDPAMRDSPYALIVNRVSAYPSSASHPQLVLYVKQYLGYLESIGADVINGYTSYLVGTSKAMQLGILEELGLRYPRARVIHHPAQATRAAADLSFPVLVKPNVGGSGTGILKFETMSELKGAVQAAALDMGVDHTALVQEYVLPKDQCIFRVEFLNGRYLYSIRLPTSDESFNYCPADGCNIGEPDLAIESYTPPANIIQDVEQILVASHCDLGSVEYLINAEDDRVYYYDVNPLSNFVANAPEVLGFDPTVKLVDFILDRAGTLCGS